MLSLLNDVTHWRNRAEEVRGVAEHLPNQEARRVMFGIADGYDRLAEGGEARIAARRTRNIEERASGPANVACDIRKKIAR
jgi:hypothetical protein